MSHFLKFCMCRMRNIPCMVKSVERGSLDSKEAENGWIRHPGHYLSAVMFRRSGVGQHCRLLMMTTLHRSQPLWDVSVLSRLRKLSVLRLRCSLRRMDSLIVYTDGSVQRGVKCGWGYTASLFGGRDYQGGLWFCTVDNLNYVYGEVKAISKMLDWVRIQAMTRIVCLTDSMSTLSKTQTGMLHEDWVASIGRRNIQCIWWIFCPGHAAVCGNKHADILAGEATNESPLTLDPSSLGVASWTY